MKLETDDERKLESCCPGKRSLEIAQFDPCTQALQKDFTFYRRRNGIPDVYRCSRGRRLPVRLRLQHFHHGMIEISDILLVIELRSDEKTMTLPRPA